jgi:dCMP deaminase
MTLKQADKMYLQICQIIAHQSYAKRAQVGAVIVKGNNILSYGWNGMPAGLPNVCEHTIDGEVHTKDEVLHAESNAFMKLCQTGGPGCKGATLYCTYSPCIDCAKMIVQAGIARVVYLRDYRSEQGLALLKDCGIQYEQFPMHEFVQDFDINDVMFE